MKPENPYEKEHCKWCGKSLSDCYDNLCVDLQNCIKEDAWDEGYDACARQRISEQEGWQTDEPSEEEEGPFLLDLGNHNHKLADIYVPDTPYREAHFKDTSHIGRLMCPYTFSRHVKRWKRL